MITSLKCILPINKLKSLLTFLNCELHGVKPKQLSKVNLIVLNLINFNIYNVTCNIMKNMYIYVNTYM